MASFNCNNLSLVFTLPANLCNKIIDIFHHYVFISFIREPLSLLSLFTAVKKKKKDNVPYFIKQCLFLKLSF